MIDRNHRLALTKQAALLGLSRGSVYYEPVPVSDTDLALMRRLDQLHLEFPFAGARMLRGLLAAEGSKVGRRHVTTLMRRMGIEAIYRRPNTSKPAPFAWKAQMRLCGRFRSLTRKGKRPTVVATAIARELAAFIWAINREVMAHATAS